MDPEKFCSKLVECVEKISASLKQDDEFSNLTVVSHKVTGEFYIRIENGNYVPLSTLEHRVYASAIRLYVLNGYAMLAEHLLSATDYAIAYFGLRTLRDVGMKVVDVLFAPEVSDVSRKKYATMDALASMAGITSVKDRRLFLKLLSEERENLDEDVRETFEKIEKSYLNGNNHPSEKLIGKARTQISRKLGTYIEPVVLPPLLQKAGTNFNWLHSTFSEVVHGSPLHMHTLFKVQTPETKRDHILIFVWNTGLNVLIRTRPFVGDSKVLKEIDDLIAMAEAPLNALRARRDARVAISEND